MSVNTSDNHGDKEKKVSLRKVNIYIFKFWLHWTVKLLMRLIIKIVINYYYD